MDTSELQHDHFSGLIGERFEAVGADGTTLDLGLAEAAEQKANPNATQGFTLLFRSDSDEVVGQQIYEITHVALGTHLMFLVPVGQDGGHTLYEAVFSR